MKTITLFLILIISFVNAKGNCEVKTNSNGKHCTKCDECDEDVCAECEVGWAKTDDGQDDCTICAAGYSLHDGKCVKCDEHCASGCSDKGAGKCDSQCQAEWGLVKSDDQGTKSWTCLECDGGCTSGCDERATLGKKDQCDETCAALTHVFIAKDFVCEKCDTHCTDGCEAKHGCKTTCESGYTLSGKPTDEYPCKQCDVHCTKCDDNGATFCDKDYCVEGWVFDETSKKCVQCDVHCTDGCKATDEGKNKCHSTCEAGYYVPTEGDKVHTCQPCLTNCDACVNQNECITCKKGYTLNEGLEKDEKDQCIKIDCTPVDKNCDICVGPDRHDLTCEQCKTGYAPEFDVVYQYEEKDERHRCVSTTTEIVCTRKIHQPEEKTELEYLRKGKCYTRHFDDTDADTYEDEHEYFKYEQRNGKTVKCYFYDEDCEYRVQKPSTITFPSCTKIEDGKYVITDKKCGKGTLMYSDSTCKTDKSWVSGCYKLSTDKYVNLDAEKSMEYTLYHEKTCNTVDALPSAIIYEDKECTEIENDDYTCVWPVEPSPNPNPDPVDTSCEVANCSDCSEDKAKCKKCATGYTLKDEKCEKNPDGSNNDGSGDKCGSVMNIIMLTILIISLMI